MIKFYPSVLNGQISAPPSKECGLIMMFAAAMAATETTITNLPECKDIKTAAECLEALGGKVKLSGSGRLTAVIEPFPKVASLQRVNFNFRESATTARFLTVMASAYGIPANCQAEGTLIKRSQASMTGRMAIRGASFSSFSYPLKLDGRLFGGRYELQGDEGSEFISALLTGLPVLKDDSTIVLLGKLYDDGYVQTTLDILSSFGIKIEKTDEGFFIPGKQYYQSPVNLECENSWSLGTMWAAAGCVCALNGGHVTVNDLPTKTNQIYRQANNTFPLLGQKFEYFNADAGDCPELANIYAAIAIARGASIDICGIPQLKYRETNRLRTIGQCMENFGVTYKVNDDGMTITGKPGADYPWNMIIDTMGDPWLFMSIAIASLAFTSPVTIKDESCAEKIYGDFLKDFASLGGKFEILK